jgi:hypothetical protein
VAVGAAAVAAFAAVGFTAGVFVPSRFTAPPAALGAALALVIASRVAVNHDAGYTLISPVNPLTLVPGLGIFYHDLPDLAMAQAMLFGGLAAAVLGALGLPAAAGGRRLRTAAATFTVVGLVAIGAALGLATTARIEAQGVIIPALHDAASEQPIPFTPVRRQGAAIPILLQPAFKNALPAITAALEPMLHELAGLPGAPVRLQQVAPAYLDPTSQPTLSGSPPVLSFTVLPDLFKSAGATVRAETQLWLVDSVIGGGIGIPGQLSGTPAQQAVELGLLKATGVSLPAGTHAFVGYGSVPLPSSRSGGTPVPGPGSPVYTSAQRFAALSAAARHAWLAAHLTALQAGKISLAEVP